ncbi:MAG: hypothetical protein CR966_00325 [Pseudomonadales bacterium]|nr:MAG: hypothetical protein CR966_00325 [Pseudomonadales bacterium]
MNQPTNQPINQSTNQPINQSTNQPNNQPKNAIKMTSNSIYFWCFASKML